MQVPSRVTNWWKWLDKGPAGHGIFPVHKEASPSTLWVHEHVALNRRCLYRFFLNLRQNRLSSPPPDNDGNDEKERGEAEDRAKFECCMETPDKVWRCHLLDGNAVHTPLCKYLAEHG